MKPSIEDSVEHEPLPAIDRPVVMFVISRTYNEDVSQQALYNATRGNWRIGEGSRNQAEIALGIADGVVRTAYAIDRWGTADEETAPKEAGGAPNRSYFEGHETDETRSWLDSSVRHLAPAKGAANPVRLFLEGVPGPADESAEDISGMLQTEALGRIMFGNSELFHSNMLAWIFETFPDQADEVFGSLVPGLATGAGTRRVERERENLDLVMHWPDRGSLVIENKVFSVPNPDQLDKYAGKMSKWKLPVGGAFLLSPTRHSFLERGYSSAFQLKNGSPITWHHLSFETLAESLELAFDGIRDSYEVETVRRYCTVLRALSALMARALIGSIEEEAFLDALSLAQTLPKQAVTGLVKARAAHVAALLIDEVAEAGVHAGGAESGMSHSQPWVSWFMRTTAGEEEILTGWQYQEGVLRLAMILDHLRGKGKLAKMKRAEFARQYPELFLFDHLDEILGTMSAAVSPSSELEGPFGHFDPNFVYRYKKAHGLSVQQLIDLTVAHAKYLDRLSNVANLSVVT
ncbi:PD-(D/E)XK nuclease family protein [Arthrobacter sp. NPDC093128]|uniref:PD-(D/E)XK nuclease family protein n=1 Tax=Arthrobacter sp. NPDC093128 TaxID=3154979 RepID=UPI0034174A1B